MEHEWNDAAEFGTPASERGCVNATLSSPLRLLGKAAILLAGRSRPQSPLGKACKYLIDQYGTPL